MTGRRVWIGLSLALLAVGCGTPPKEYFYTLSDYTLDDYNTVGDLATGEAAAAGSNYSVAIAPVSVPEGVDRPQMVVRAGGHRVELSELHRWAEPLKSEIPRVLAVHLRRALRTARIATTDQSASLDADYRIAVDVQRFESILGERVTIEALWSVRAAQGGRARTGRSFVCEPVRGPDHEALAAAHGRALAQVAGELAGAIRTLRSTGPLP
ncbi:MAG: membrane integrity-associated transporter subunit PqiC [Gammaproteobacteria bacterium]|nr:membrane integrity-associated transporter subunit PqiC [Gammaproteobacteria bacterium]